MENLLKPSLLGLFFGTIGTTLGGILGILIKNNSNRFLSFILSLAAGLMTSVVCFELIPEALEISNITSVISGISLGILLMILCDIIIKSKFNTSNKTFQKPIKTKSTQQQNLLKTGLIISIGLAIHNIPEGLAIGSGFKASEPLGYSLAIAIAFHDVPEGISMSIPLKYSGLNPLKILWYILLSGFATGIGALLGCIIGEISEQIISLCLAFAAGAMLYIVSGELIPESNDLYKGKLPVIGNIIGFIVGLLVI